MDLIDPRFYGEARLMVCLGQMEGQKYPKRLRFNEIVSECLQWGRMRSPHQTHFDREVMLQIVEGYNTLDEVSFNGGTYDPGAYAWMEVPETQPEES